MSDDLTNWLTYLAYVLGGGLLWLAIAEVRAAWRQTSRANLDAVLRGCMDRHPAGKSDAIRREQMAAIAEAEEAWDRDVSGSGR